MDIEEIKKYLRIDYDGEDEELEAFTTAAEEYLNNAGIKADYESELYKLAVKLLVSNWYSNRIPIGTVTQAMEYSLRRIIIQLQLGEDDGDD
ncbi:MAG: phage gp6-like head-tail connector protein [Clostridia bacterium]|nr:phage gp6-like head-tail connector protein [Clostridia bacterium]MBR0470020.1 phage gp6-like head-tail connector protein [Clostridia bacterium]